MTTECEFNQPSSIEVTELHAPSVALVLDAMAQACAKDQDALQKSLQQAAALIRLQDGVINNLLLKASGGR